MHHQFYLYQLDLSLLSFRRHTERCLPNKVHNSSHGDTQNLSIDVAIIFNEAIVNETRDGTLNDRSVIFGMLCYNLH